MKALERREAGEWRRIELQLDTAQIVLVIASLLGLCAASFYLGRWMERDRWQEVSGKGSASGTRAGQQETVSDLTFFDALGGRPATEPVFVDDVRLNYGVGDDLVPRQARVGIQLDAARAVVVRDVLLDDGVIGAV